jgi:dTDP-glucose 4,6-dehydratase
VTIHSNKDKTKAGSRFYINTDDVADGVFFLIENGVAGEKYNLTGEREIDNLELAKMISKLMKEELIYEMVDFHTSRPGHDLRYALDGTKMKNMGWVPKVSIEERLKEVITWSLENNRWLL